MKNLLFALPFLALGSSVYADFISDLKTSYETAKQTLGLNRPEETTSPSQQPQEDTLAALFRRLGGSTSTASTLESNYDAVKKADAAAISAANEAIRTQDPTKKREAEALLKQADDKRAAFEQNFQAKLKEMADTLGKDRATMQELRAKMGARQERGILDLLFPSN